MKPFCGVIRDGRGKTPYSASPFDFAQDRLHADYIDRSQAPALIFVHKSSREQQNPEGVQAISRGLSEATPPDGKPNQISTPAGSQQA